MTKHFVLNNNNSVKNVLVAQQNEALRHRSPATFQPRSVIQSKHRNNRPERYCKTKDPDAA